MLIIRDRADAIINSLKKYEVVDDNNNIIDTIWKDKPSYKTDKVFIHDIKYTGRTPIEKYSMISQVLMNKKKETNTIRLLISALDHCLAS